MGSKPFLGNANDYVLGMAAEPEVAAGDGGRGGMLSLCTRSRGSPVVAVYHSARATSAYACGAQSKSSQSQMCRYHNKAGRAWRYRRKGLGSRLQSRWQARKQGWHRRHPVLNHSSIRSNLPPKPQETLPQACGYDVLQETSGITTNTRHPPLHCAPSHPPSLSIVVTSLTIVPSCLSPYFLAPAASADFARIAIRVRLIDSSGVVQSRVAAKSLSMSDR